MQGDPDAGRRGDGREQGGETGEEDDGVTVQIPLALLARVSPTGFDWQVPGLTPVSVSLYDASGRMVRNLYGANDGVRTGRLALDTRSLAVGIYLVRLETAGGSATRKVVILNSSKSHIASATGNFQPKSDRLPCAGWMQR